MLWSGHSIAPAVIGVGGGLLALCAAFRTRRAHCAPLSPDDRESEKSSAVSKISIVIPWKFESEKTLSENVRSLRAKNNDGGGAVDIEIVVASSKPLPSTLKMDGGVVVWAPLHPTDSRSGALNKGYLASTGDVVAFLHADTKLPTGYATMMTKTVERVAPVGCFKLRFDHPSYLFRVVEFFANSVRRIPYGDQCYFVKRSFHERVGMFSDLKMMEDVDYIVSKCKRHEWTVVDGSDVYALTSPSRYLNEDGTASLFSVLRNVVKNNIIVAAVAAKIVTPDQCAEWYYKGTSRKNK